MKSRLRKTDSSLAPVAFIFDPDGDNDEDNDDDDDDDNMFVCRSF